MRICIVGTGYVGLVTAACFAEMGSQVFCVDIDEEVVRELNQGGVHIYEPGLEDLVRKNLEAGRLGFTTDLQAGQEGALFIFICVGTPSSENGECDMSSVYQVAGEIGRSICEEKIVVNKSTVPVGTVDKVRSIIRQELGQRDLDLDFDVVSNPEFLKEGDAVNDFLKPDRVIVGTDSQHSAELLESLYAPFARSRDKLLVMSPRSAEISKYSANCMLATKISFINEIANICEKVEADVEDVRRGIGSDPRIGYRFIYPGAGYGGSCFPKDVRALIRTSEDSGYSPGLLTSVDSVNEHQKRLLAEKIEAYFLDKGGVKDKLLAVWGLAFKANTDDIREASALVIMDYLTRRGMRIRAYDPRAGERVRQIFADNDLVSVVDSEYDALDGADALAVVTEWHQFRNPDFPLIKEKMRNPAVFDGRNLYSPTYVRKMGFIYSGIGR
ncbi:MAG: UDP-glucose/GDP-mannose dehydrogenase family protein [Desulfohalobiaceae bacterium]|nr:UDP-glucose/GDP-mannose dehydrogenase family protein [Desulfohalobiaceae bacterium]